MTLRFDASACTGNVPRGLSPDDIEVRYDPCGGGYTVEIKEH